MIYVFGHRINFLFGFLIFLLIAAFPEINKPPELDNIWWIQHDCLSDLSALSQKIKFIQPLKRAPHSLIQAANTSISLYLELPELFYLQTEATAKKTKIFMKIIDEKGKEGATIKLKKNGLYQQINLNKLFSKSKGQRPSKDESSSLGKQKEFFRLNANRLYFVSFVTKGPPEEAVIWKKLIFLLPQEKKFFSSSSTSLPLSHSPLVSSTSEAPKNKIGKKKALTKPDIFLYVIDALRQDHLGCYGYFRATSPCIDLFSQDSALFLKAYANSSWTRSSGATILTGLRPKNHRTMKREAVMPNDLMTIPEILKEVGYETLAVIANGNLHPVWGFAQGFDEFSYLGGLARSWQINETLFKLLDSRLRKPQRKPLFCLIWTIDPHDPYRPNKEDSNCFNIQEFQPLPETEGNLFVKIRAGEIKLTPSQEIYLKTLYDQVIRSNDRSFGQFLDFLKAKNNYERSVIILTSDHGEELFDHGSVGHGSSLYEEQIRVPLMIKAPLINPGKREIIAQHIDLLPTILEIIGLEKPAYLPGESLLSLEGKSRLVFSELNLDGYNLISLATNFGKIIYYQEQPGIQNFKPYFEFFKIQDPRETLPLRPQSFDEKFLQQTILLYCFSPDFPSPEAKFLKEIPQDLEKHLRSLGYLHYH